METIFSEKSVSGGDRQLLAWFKVANLSFGETRLLKFQHICLLI